MTTVGESPLAKQKHLIVKDVMVPKMIPVGGLVVPCAVPTKVLKYGRC